MEILRFVHHFFHFDSAAWSRVTQGRTPSWTLAKQFFVQNNLLPRRLLRNGEPRNFEEAWRIHERQKELDDEMGIRAISECCAEYPSAIVQFIPPERRPVLLYLRGTAIPAETSSVAIVGTRRPSAQGGENATAFSSYLTAIGVRIVSGLARGIDTLAHEQNIELGTIAVLGSGVGAVYPEQNQALAHRILSGGGALVSPFPTQQVPLPQNFPERNEIISAISAGTIVIEGAEKSGAAITGRHALAMGKGVVALTQDFRSEYGRGAIRLCQEGAVLVTKEEEAVEAIYSRLGGFGSSLPASQGTSRSFTFDEFQESTQLTVPEALALLEEGILHGKIEKFGSRRYRRR